MPVTMLETQRPGNRNVREWDASVFFFSFFYTCRLYNRRQIRRNLFKESSVEVEVSPRELRNGIELYACDGNSTMGKSQSSNRRAKRNLKHNFSFFSSRRREKMSASLLNIVKRFSHGKLRKVTMLLININ